MKWFFAIFCSIMFICLGVFGTHLVYSLLFPIKFEEEIAAASQSFGVDEAVIFSVINVESRFKAEAVSSKGAVGLMQIMPSTAKELASAQGMSDFNLKEAKHNITLGTYYIAKLCKQFDNLETALCAYNAGPTNVKNWLMDKRYSDDGKTLKEIPFAETKGYVKKFHKNFKYYSARIAR